MSDHIDVCGCCERREWFSLLTEINGELVCSECMDEIVRNEAEEAESERRYGWLAK